MQKDQGLSSRSDGMMIWPGRSVAVSRREKLMTIAWLLGSALVAAWMLCLLFPVGTSASASVAPSYSSVALQAPTGNFVRKGDRLDRIPARTDAGGVSRVIARSPALKDGGQIGADSAPQRSQSAPTSDRKLPVGCEPAFSKLVATRNQSARCVTAIEQTAETA